MNGFFMVEILRTDGELFFEYSKKKEYPSQDKQHASQWRHRAQHTQAGETKHKQTAAEKEDAEKEKQPGIVQFLRGELTH